MLTKDDREDLDFFMIGKAPDCPIMALMRKAYAELLRREELDRQCREHPTKNEERS